MLSNDYFYFSLTRKYVILFGNMFNNITLKRINNTDDSEIERWKVPLAYGPKEKYYARLHGDPDLERGTAITLPRMSFEMLGITYDSGRKQGSLLRAAKANTSTRTQSQYMGVPYDLNFELTIYTRHIDDGTHIVEQILPYFNPDYTPTIENMPDIGITKDVPIILNSVNQQIEHEGNFDAVRYVTWSLNFTMKVYFYGPISSSKIIRTVITNVYNDPALKAGHVVRINTESGNNGTYKLDDIVYQGSNYETATAYGIVIGWGQSTGNLIIGGAQGTFKVNNTIRAVSTNATYNIASFHAGALLLANVTITPDPITASPNSDYGYTTTITEFPETLD